MNASTPGLRQVLFVVLLVGCVSKLSAQTESDEVTLGNLLRSAARETASKLAARPVLLRITPADAHPLVRQIFAEEAMSAGSAVFMEEGQTNANLTVDVRGMRMSAVSLNNSSYLRNLSVTIGVFADDRRSGAVLWSKEYRFSRADTVRGIVLPESRELRDDASPGWIESLLTPILMTATTIVIVILLFSVRGS